MSPGPFRRLTASSPPTGSCCTPCTKWACSPAAGRNPPILWARPCGSTPTATRPFTTPWCGCPGATGRCCTPSWTPRATSARSTPGTWPMPPPGIPRPSWTASAPSCSGTWTTTPWIWWTITTAPWKSRCCCPPPFPTFWSRPTPALPWAWPATSAALTWRRCAGPPSPESRIRTATRWRSCPPRISPPAGSCSMTRRKWGPSTKPAGAASACGQSGGM